MSCPRCGSPKHAVLCPDCVAQRQYRQMLASNTAVASHVCTIGIKPKCPGTCATCGFAEKPSLIAMLSRVRIRSHNADMAHRGRSNVMAAAFLKALEEN